MGMGRVALQMIDYPGLCGSQGDPILGSVLKLEKDGFGYASMPDRSNLPDA